jgi:hypothetical protein
VIDMNEDRKFTTVATQIGFHASGFVTKSAEHGPILHYKNFETFCVLAA